LFNLAIWKQQINSTFSSGELSRKSFSRRCFNLKTMNNRSLWLMERSAVLRYITSPFLRRKILELPTKLLEGQVCVVEEDIGDLLPADTFRELQCHVTGYIYRLSEDPEYRMEAAAAAYEALQDYDSMGEYLRGVD
jgi:hypothetical protein